MIPSNPEDAGGTRKKDRGGATLEAVTSASGSYAEKIWWRHWQ